MNDHLADGIFGSMVNSRLQMWSPSRSKFGPSHGPAGKTFNPSVRWSFMRGPDRKHSQGLHRSNGPARSPARGGERLGFAVLAGFAGLALHAERGLPKREAQVLSV